MFLILINISTFRFSLSKFFLFLRHLVLQKKLDNMKKYYLNFCFLNHEKYFPEFLFFVEKKTFILKKKPKNVSGDFVLD